MARADALAQETDAYLEEAEKASLRTRELTLQLLTFAEGGSPITRPTDILQIIKESAGFCLRGSNVRYSLTSEGALWTAQVDPGQISQLLGNLIINANQAMPEGGNIEVGAANISVGSDLGLPLSPGDYLRVTVADEGLGIAKKHLARIFDPFFSTKQAGSGLGLATTEMFAVMPVRRLFRSCAVPPANTPSDCSFSSFCNSSPSLLRSVMSRVVPCTPMTLHTGASNIDQRDASG